ARLMNATGSSGVGNPANVITIVSTIGPSKSAVGIRKRAKSLAPAAIISGYKRYVYHGISAQVTEPVSIPLSSTPDSLPNTYTVTIGTTITITITRML